ncbi:MAG TPA: hypothetical protein VMZ03_03980 [Chitinophagaceae bacterium]|nr:hypothetical protein [Chitinophagaceae bacterium]
MSSILRIGNTEVEALIGYVAVSIAGLLFMYYFIRWSIRANDIVNNQLAMIAFLIKLCEKQGVDQKEIQALQSKFEIKDGEVSSPNWKSIKP